MTPPPPREVLTKFYNTLRSNDIAALAGISRDVIYQWLDYYDIERTKKERINLNLPRTYQPCIPSKKFARPYKLPTPPEALLRKIYPFCNLDETGRAFGLGQTIIHKWLSTLGIEKSKKMRKPRSEAHRTNLSSALKKLPSREKNGQWNECEQCGTKFYVILVRRKTAKFCSKKCKNQSLTSDFKEKKCVVCGNTFTRGSINAGNFKSKQTCSRVCTNILLSKKATENARYGEANPGWKGDSARRRTRRGPHRWWRNEVLRKDKATCQRCGVTDAVLVAHHIKPWEAYPELRFEVSNGLTLCEKCHFKEHGWDLAPSVQVSVDERGIQTRRWVGECLSCGRFLIKQSTDMRTANKKDKGRIKNYAFRNKTCSGKLKGVIFRNNKIKKGESYARYYYELADELAETGTHKFRGEGFGLEDE